MYYQKIDNVEELLNRMDDQSMIYLKSRLKFAGISVEKTDSDNFKQTLIKGLISDIESVSYSIVEEFVYRISPLEDISFNTEFMDDIFYRNSDFFEMFIFLFDKFEYQYMIDYIDESIDLDLYFYWDFCLRTGICEKPFCSERISYFWYSEYKSLVDRCYQIASRPDKVDKIIQKTGANKK